MRLGSLQPRAGSLWALAALRDLLGRPETPFDPDPQLYDCTWDDVVDAVRDHRITQILVTAPWFAQIEDNARERIRNIATTETAHAMQLCADTEEVSRLLTDAGIRNLVVKGVALAFLQGRPLTARGSGDVDVWVHPDDVVAAQEALFAGGWTKHHSVTSHLEPTDGWRYRLFHYFGPERSFGRQGHCDVDLHWRLIPARSALDVSFDQAWSDSVCVEALRGTVRTLNNRDALRHTTAHGLKDGWSTLREVSDVVFCARVLNVGELERIETLDGNVTLALATSAYLDPRCSPMVRVRSKTLYVARVGMNRCLTLDFRQSIVHSQRGVGALRARINRACWLVQSHRRVRTSMRYFMEEVLPLKLILSSPKGAKS